MIVYTDHKNLMYDNFKTEIMLLWCLLLKEYGPIIKYIKGTDNDAKYALSRLPLIGADVTERDITRENLADRYCVKTFDGDEFPLLYQKIEEYELKDKELLDKLKPSNYHTKNYRGGGIVTQLICKVDKNVMPIMIRKYVVN